MKSPPSMFRFKNILLTSFALLAVQLSFGQIRTHSYQELESVIRIEQWEVVDVVFEASKEVEQPFEQQAFAMVSSDGSTQQVALFYNGNRDWVFRYSSKTVGKKTFEIQSEIEGIDGRNGSFVVSANTKENRHGGIVTRKDNPKHFFYEDGEHYFNLAFECDWLFALDYGQNDLVKTEHLLDLVARYGFNQVVTTVYSYDVGDGWLRDPRLDQYPEFDYGRLETVFPFLGSNSEPDFSGLNVEFFKHYDRVVAAMHDKEIVNHLMIYVWNKLVSWPEMNSEADDRYFDYVIKRYQAFPNIIWDVSKEAVSPIAKAQGRSTTDYILQRAKRARKMDAFGRLLSVHDYGFCRKHSDDVDFISMQNWRSTIYEHMLDAYNSIEDKPIFNIEHGGYEEAPIEVFPGAYTNAEVCLKRNYMCLFAGGYTTYYWQGTSWSVVIHNPFEQPRDFITPKFEYFAHMRSLFDKVSFENMHPSVGNNSSGYNLTNKRDGEILLYVPKENHYCSPKKQIERDFNDENATEQWFNTLTGEFTPEVKYERNGFGFWDWRPWRGEADAVLIIRNLEPKE